METGITANPLVLAEKVAKLHSEGDFSFPSNQSQPVDRTQLLLVSMKTPLSRLGECRRLKRKK